jgi:A/G-specific adenine glycosylase
MRKLVVKEAFFEKYPDWASLGEASQGDLQNFIKPLGLFKQRGSRLFKLAQEIKKRKGAFPIERTQVEDLPMMGQYIANAYELYIIKKRTPLLDVNMARLLERFFGPRDLADIRYDPYLQTLAYKIVDHPKSKELNWAVLDYASLICQKNKPNCTNCLLLSNCRFEKS